MDGLPQTHRQKVWGKGGGLTEKEPDNGTGHWDEDPEFPLADWKYEVQNNDTRLGYHEWVAKKREE